MKTCFRLLLLLSLVATAPGCSRFRQLTRRDYALLRDPFTGSALTEDGQTSLTDADPPPLDSVQASDAGFVKVADEATDQAVSRVAADYSRVASSEINQHPVPTLAGAQGVRLPGSEIQSAAEDLAASTGEAARPVDMAGMAAFMEEQASASGLTDTANELKSDFSEFAAKRQQEWKQQVAEVEDTVEATTNPIRQVSRTISSPAGPQEAAALSAATAQPRAAQPFAASDHKDAAVPLIARGTQAPFAAAAAPPIGAADPFAPISPKTEAAAGPQGAVFDEPVNPAEQLNPFAEFDHQVDGTAAPSGRSLDAGFSFDSGWRPSNTVHP